MHHRECGEGERDEAKKANEEAGLEAAMRRSGGKRRRVDDRPEELKALMRAG